MIGLLFRTDPGTDIHADPARHLPGGLCACPYSCCVEQAYGNCRCRDCDCQKLRRCEATEGPCVRCGQLPPEAA